MKSHFLFHGMALFRKTALAVACCIAAPAWAADYFVVVPVKGRTAAPVPAIGVTLTTATLPAVIVGRSYSYNLNNHLVVTGDAGYTGGGVTWSVVNNSLPAGLYLTSDGFISGSTGVVGTGSITVRASYKTASGDQAYQVQVLGYSASATPGQLVFGSVAANTESAALSVDLTNTGETLLDVGSAAVSGPFVLKSTTCGTTLSPMSSCSYSVTFKPTNSGDFTGNLTGSTLAGGWTVALSGTGKMPSGQIAYTTPGTYTWTAPAGVTSVSVVAVGPGSKAGGGLGWKNNIPVVPGQSYTVSVGNGIYQYAPRDSYFISPTVVKGGGAVDYTGGTFVGDGGGNGGAAGSGAGGGAGGYSGEGGAGSSSFTTPGIEGSGGGGGGGACNSGGYCGGGGGVGLYGKGSNGAGALVSTTAGGSGGGGGSGGASGGVASYSFGFGGAYGGGRAYNRYSPSAYKDGANGAVRIIWGTNRAFPSTNTADQ